MLLYPLTRRSPDHALATDPLAETREAVYTGGGRSLRRLRPCSSSLLTQRCRRGVRGFAVCVIVVHLGGYRRAVTSAPISLRYSCSASTCARSAACSASTCARSAACSA